MTGELIVACGKKTKWKEDRSTYVRLYTDTIHATSVESLQNGKTRQKQDSKSISAWHPGHSLTAFFLHSCGVLLPSVWVSGSVIRLGREGVDKVWWKTAWFLHKNNPVNLVYCSVYFFSHLMTQCDSICRNLIPQEEFLQVFLTLWAQGCLCLTSTL